MICPNCKQYVPEGLGLTKCLECHADLTSVFPTTQQSSATLNQEDLKNKPLLSASQALTISKNSSAARSFKWKIWIWIIALIVIPILLILFPRSERSYYIDSDKTVGMFIPDNRVFQFKGSFFYLTIRYPQDMYASVLGTEVFLRNGGATHFLEIAVTNSGRGGLPIRYTVKSILLSDGDKEYPFLLYQRSLYTDEIKKQLAAGAKVGAYEARSALQYSAKLLPKLDFASGVTNQDELYFGYEFKKPPKKLYLSFEIEIYKLGGEPKEVVKETIDLTRVNGDPLDYIKRRTWRRR